jgi:proteasome assembly chaperone (PAC2) family protein
MTFRVEWRTSLQQLPEAATVLIAFPGVGNIGKVAVESIRELHDTTELARLHPDGLPPLALLDEDGLLAPPHFSLSMSETTTGETLLSLTGINQPPEPSHQSIIARQLLEFFEKHGAETLLVLAGLTAPPEHKEVFAVASSASFRIDLESLGVDVRRDEPKRGVVGLSALMASSGPLYNMNSACIIATTLGSSQDTLASQRVVEHLERWFSFGLRIPTGGGEWLKEELKKRAPASNDDLVKELTASHDAFYM